jgi:hypothetical protein
VTWRCSAPLRNLAAGNPAHRAIVTQAPGVIDVPAASEPAEIDLPQHANLPPAPFHSAKFAIFADAGGR